MKKLILLTSVALLSFGAINESLAEVFSGSCRPDGDATSTCAWSYDSSTDKITISGTGAMKNYDSILSIPWHAWPMNKATSVEVGDGITNLSNYAFQGMKLDNIRLPKTLNNIGRYALVNSYTTGAFVIPDSVTSIGDQGVNLSKITSLTLPSSLTDVGGAGLGYLKSLEELIIPDDLDTSNWTSHAFLGNNENITIRCLGDETKCKNSLQKFLPSSENGTCSSFCLKNTTFKPVTESQCKATKKYGWNGVSCVKKDSEGNISCATGFVEWNKKCFDEYPFAKKRWTPAEANEWLHDGNDNFVIITFKK